MISYLDICVEFFEFSDLRIFDMHGTSARAQGIDGCDGLLLPFLLFVMAWKLQELIFQSSFFLRKSRNFSSSHSRDQGHAG